MRLKSKNIKQFFILSSIIFSNHLLAEEAVILSEDLRKVLSPLGRNIVGKSLPGIVIDNPYRYISGKPGKYSYQKVLKGDANSNVGFETHSKVDGSVDGLKKWTLKIDDDFIEEWEADSEGGVHLVAQIDIDAGYRVELTPHLLLPVGARPGQHWKSESHLNVYDTSDPDTVAYEGKLFSGKVYEGHFEVTTQAGKFDAILISDKYEINIGAVNIKDRRFTFYALDVGKIAEIDGFHVSAFLFFHQQGNGAKVLQALPQSTDN